MPQFFVDKSFKVGSRAQITGRDAHHILDVLRLKVGDWLILSDGKGKSYKSKITSAKSKMVEAVVEEEVQRRAAMPPPALAFAVIKHDRSEWIIQKAVELGCAHLMPFYCQRTIPKFKSAGEKIRRWRDIALEAAKQSGLPIVPKVDVPAGFDDLCALMRDYEKTILFWEGEKQRDLRSHISSIKSGVLLIIGPEGGFDESEVERAKSSGAVTASLGQQILRVETAAIAALSIVQYESGNLSL